MEEDEAAGNTTGTSHLNRTALNACRAAARAGKYDVLVIYDLDRFNRNLRDLLNLRHEFQKLGIPVWSICDNLEMTSCDKSVFIQVVMRGVFSQVERDKINRHMREGRERHVREGKFPGGPVSYGYEIGSDHRLVVHEETAQIVRMIFRWIADGGMSTYAVAERLNALDIPSPMAQRGKKTRRGNPRFGAGIHLALCDRGEDHPP